MINVGLAGEFKLVIKDKNGDTKTEIPWQKNLILNQGLDALANYDIYSRCLIGTGNSYPSVTQTALDSFYQDTYSSSVHSNQFSYDPKIDGDFYKVNRVFKYIFNIDSDVNIAELGLATSNKVLCTRALIKDANDNPTIISLLAGEILEVYYKLWFVVDVRDKTYQINVPTVEGRRIVKTDTYNVIVRPAYVGGSTEGSGSWSYCVGSGVGIFNGNTNSCYKTGEVRDIYNGPTGTILYSYSPYSNLNYSKSTYVNGSYYRDFTVHIPVNKGNGSLRSIGQISTMGFWQIRFGRVDDDSPLVKNNTQKMSVPIRFSWGRYEGEL